MNGSICEQCSPKCSHCETGQKSQCLLCNNEGIGRSFIQTQNCGCIDGYYDDETELNCKKCEGINCKSCNSDLKCL